VGDVINKVGFWPFWLGLSGTGRKPLDGNILLKYWKLG